MKKVFFIPVIPLALFLISWGFKGHRAVAAIAQNHLTSNTAYLVSFYLKGENMANVATWADENKNTTTAPWHFLNLPLGLTHEQFIQEVQKSDNNVYTAILKTEASLKDNKLGLEEKKRSPKISDPPGRRRASADAHQQKGR